MPTFSGMRPLAIYTDPPKRPIVESPGFAKKELADFHLDMVRVCEADCLYCSTPATTNMRIMKDGLANQALREHGRRMVPGDVGFTVRFHDFEHRVEEQLRSKPKDNSWGKGSTLMVSQFTDPYSPWLYQTGLTNRVLGRVFARTSFRVRILTKFNLVAKPENIEFLKANKERVVVGLSIGTLDDDWASRVELRTSSPSARIRALHTLQDEGIPAYGMLCPTFPDVLARDGVERLVAAIRPEKCETVWSEPFNDRNNWRRIAESYERAAERESFASYFSGPNASVNWSLYAGALYRRVHWALGEHASKHRYLLYQDGMTARAREEMRGAPGVLFQSMEKPS